MIHNKILRCLLFLSFTFFQIQISAQFIAIGNDTLSTGEYDPSPINIYYRSHRQQIVYTKAELNSAGIQGGQILELGWFVVSPPIHAMPNYTISLKHDTIRDGSSQIAGPFSKVLQIPSYMPVAGGFDMLPLDSPFAWNGIDNLVVDVCWDIVNPSYDNSGRVRYYTDSSYTTAYERDDGMDMCGESLSDDTPDKPQIQFLFSPGAPNDAGTIGINQGAVVCAGSQPIVATVANWGNNQLTSLTVNWSVNGVVQTAGSITGTLDTLTGTGSYFQSVALGSFSFASSTTYVIKIWTSSPNGMLDTLNFNDTLIQVSGVGMSGIYTVGGTSPDYLSFNAAINDLINLGVCDTVRIRARNGTYNEQLNLATIPGVSAQSPVIFESESGDSSSVTISHNSSSSFNFVLKLEQVDWVSFRNLTFEATNTTYSRVVRIDNNISNVGFYNNRFKGVITTSSSSFRSLLLFNNGNPATNVNFHNNLFENGSSGIDMYAPGGSHLSVHGNEFSNQYYLAVYVEEVSDAMFTDNNIHTSSAYNYFTGIYLEDSDSAFTITGNRITGLRGEAGITLYYCIASANSPSLLANNYVQLGHANSSFIAGLYISYSEYINITYNSINVTQGSSDAVALRMYGGVGQNLYNNNFFSAGSAAVDLSLNFGSISNSDHNNFYCDCGDLGNWNGLVKDIAALRASTGMDSNSTSVNPHYQIPTEPAVANIALNAAAMPLPYVLDDIDGEQRDVTTPDIGADEFTPTGIDAGLEQIIPPVAPFMAGTYPIYAVIRNHGGSAITGLTINWEINQINQPSVSWTGSISSGDSALVLLDTVQFIGGVEFDFRAYSSLPNGVADVIPINDTASVNGIMAGLGGIYTIGGLGPDFVNFTTAVDALNKGGAFDSVTFRVRTGTYNEQIIIKDFPRLDTNHYIIFESEAQDSSMVTLSFYASSLNNYVMRLEGVSGITLKHMTLHNTFPTTYNRVITLENGGRNLSFKNLRLMAGSYTSTSSSRALIYSASSLPFENILIDQCRFENGAYGIYLFFSDFRKPWNNSVVVSNCQFHNQYYRGVYLYRLEDLDFRNNYLESGTNYSSSYTSLYLYFCEGLNISMNQMNGGVSGTSNGMYFYECGPYSDGSRSLVSNNFIQTSGIATGGALSIDRSDSLDIFHNSTLVINSQTNSAALRYYYTNTSIRILNNIFQNIGGGYAYYFNASNGLQSLDNNSVYSSGTNLGYFNFTNYSDLASWQAGTGLDSNSVSALAGYTDSVDLHASSANLNANAVPLPEVITDIDGETRNISTPDIGADEFDVPTDDAGIIALTSPGKPLSVGNQSVLVTVLNNGADTLNSVTIYWEVNGVAQTPYSWTGNLPTGLMDDSVDIGTYAFLADSLYDFKIWTSLPNGKADALGSNDTLKVNDLISGLAGVYTVGGTAPDFTSFVEAVGAVNSRGIAGWVNFLIADGAYSGQSILRYMEGVSASDSVVFKGAKGDSSQVTISFASSSFSNNYMILLKGASHLSFQNIDFFRNGSTYQRIFVIDSGSVNLRFKDCVFRTYNQNTSSSSAALMMMNSGYSNDGLQIKDCEFKEGSYGIYLTGSFGQFATNSRIEDNIFRGQYYRGIYISSHQNLSVKRNKIYGNTIYSSFGGMTLYSCLNAEITNNYIHIPTNGFYGLILSDIDGVAGQPSVVSNNYINMGGTSSLRAIYLNDCDTSLVVYNTVFVNSSSAGSSAFYDDGLNYNSQVKNNIFYNQGGGYAIFVDYTTGSANTDYNNYYTTGANFGYWNGVVTDLTNWRSTSGRDSNSHSALVIFDPDTNLHIGAASMNGRAIPIPGISTDYDGDIRDSVRPDIGADEFDLPPNDVAITSFDAPKAPFFAGNSDIKVSVLNNGEDTLTSVSINWTVNGFAQPAYFWTGSLLSGDQLDSISIGTYSFLNNMAHDVKVWSSFPNNSIDANNENDTVEQLNLFPALSGVYTIGGFEPDFSNFTSAVNALNNGGVVGWVTFNVRGGTYSEQINIGEIIGVDANDTVLFQSELLDASTVDLENSGTQTIIINGANYLTFRHITISSASATSAQVIVLDGTTNNTRFTDCIIEVPHSASVQYGTYLVRAEDNGLNSNLIFRNCEFNNAAYGIYGDGFDGGYEVGFQLTNCSFNYQTYQGIYLYRYNSPYIFKNEFVSDVTSMARMVFINRSLYNLMFIKNRIHVARAGTGLEIYNHIGNNSQRALIANNFIVVSDSGTYNNFGLYLRFSDYLDIYHNNIHQASASISAEAGYFQSNSNLNLVNNVIANSGLGVSFYTSSITNFVISNNNDFFSGGTTLINAPSAVTDLVTWQNLTGLDNNSVSVDPVFYNSADLHVAQSALDSAATPLALVTLDIDDEPRDPVYPDIGADEVLFFPDDISVRGVTSPVSTCSFPDSSQIVIQVNNNGSGPQANFNLYLVVDGDTTIEQVLLINGGETYYHTFTAFYDFGLVGSYDVKCWADITNDVNRGNDTLSTQVVHYAAPVTTLTDDLSICLGSSIFLKATGGAYYTWNNAGYGAFQTVAPTTTTTYRVTITNINGCTVEDSVTITVVNQTGTASLIAAGSPVICDGDSLLLYSTNPTDIIWSNGSTDDSIWVKTAGTYFLRYNNPSSACDQSLFGSVNLTVKTAEIQVTGFTTLCIGDNVILTATEFSTGNWSTGATTSSIVVSPTKDSAFTCTWVNTSGCVFYDSVFIHVIAAQPPAQVSNMTPVDGTLGLTKPVTLTWSPAANASVYDLYIWEKGTSRPLSPIINNITTISKNYSGLLPAVTYNWQVASENSCFYTFSDTLEFSVIGIPDLIIDTIILPQSALSGSNITVTWVVKNVGTASTGSRSWFDRLWLSSDVDLRIGDDDLLLKTTNLTYLDTGQSYTNTAVIQLPQNVLSTQLVFAITDNQDAYCWVCTPGSNRGAHNYGFPELNEQNNFLWDTLPILPSPNPDLKITAINVPSAAFSGDDIVVNFDILNDGTADADITGMDLCYYISQDSVYNAGASRLYPKTPIGGAVGFSGLLDPDSTVNGAVTLTLPNYIFGDYFIHAVVDCSDIIFEALGEGNNTASSFNPINVFLTPPPDLQVSSITVNDSALSGTQLTIDWASENFGAANPIASWRDQVYLCSTPSYNADSVIASGTRYTYNPANYGGGNVGISSGIFHLQIPNGISGHYYVYVYTDNANNVFEFPFETNNMSRSDTSVYISLKPYPDLSVLSMTLPLVDTLWEDSLYQAGWLLKNIGTGPTEGSWNDRLFLSKSSTQFNAVGSWHAGSKVFTDPLLPDSSEVNDLYFQIPGISEGVYYFHVVTDYDDSQYEFNFENNNEFSSVILDPDGVYIKQQPAGSPGSGSGSIPIVVDYNDLEVKALSAPDTVNSGRSISINWNVINNGPENLDASDWWVDDIYLSTDSILDSGDPSIHQKTKTGIVANGADYTALAAFQLPNGVSGAYYLILKSDASNRLNGDTVKGNNIIHRAIQIDLTPPPDLEVTEIFVPTGSIYAGQQVYLPYTVINNGPGNIVNGSWQDLIFLNVSPAAGGNHIGGKTQTRSLVSGASYTDSILVNLPTFVSGNIYAVVSTDHVNSIYEHTNEGNNVAAEAWFILGANLLQTDLRNTAFTVPDTILLGYEYKIPYGYKNEGTTSGLGKLRNGLYLADGATFNSATDRLFGFSEPYINMGPGASEMDTVTSRLNAGEIGQFYPIMRLNITGSVPEVNLNNNDSTGMAMVVVDAEALSLGIADSNSLDLALPVYYKVEVPAQKDLLITLNSTQSGTGINEVFVSFNKVPSAVDFDYKHNGLPALNQQVLISNTQAGSYYIMVNTLSGFASAQSIAIQADTLPFSVLSISPDKVGTGAVSTTILGAQFRPGVTFSLRDGGSLISTGTIKNYVNSTEVEVLWTLDTVPVGTYDVVATNPDLSSAVLLNGLQVDTTSGYLPNLYASGPSLLRLGKSGFFTFFIENDGNVDIPYVKGDISVPDYVNIKGLSTRGYGLYTLKDYQPSFLNVDYWRVYGDIKIIPYVVRDLKPGEVVSFDITFENFPYATLPQRMRGVGNSTYDFVSGTARLIEVVRQSILNNQDSLPDPSIIALAYDQRTFFDSTMAVYIRSGLIDAADTVGIELSCSTCGDFYDFNPGSSPGIGHYDDVSLKENQTMLWEINHPNGTMGGALGWDGLQVLNQINITATQANPFKIDLKTLSSYTNNPAFLTSFSPGYDKCWPIMVASGGITGFNANKFSIDDTQFKDNTPTYGGTFSLSLSPGNDTIYLCFNSAVPSIGQDGWPGGPGQYGQNGGKGGKGGPCGNGLIAGKGGAGGAGGPGIGGYLAPGNGGAGGAGGQCVTPFLFGGAGGIGGTGGAGAQDQNGGQGGAGGSAGTGSNGGNSGNGGTSGPGSGTSPGSPGNPGSGGPGGTGTPPGNPGNPGNPGGSTPNPPGPNNPGTPSDPNNPHNPNQPYNPYYPPPVPDNGPPGGPEGPTGPGTPPPSPPPPGPGGCNNPNGSGERTPCDYWGDINRTLGCEATAVGCLDYIGTYALVGCSLGPWGCAAGAIFGGAACALGSYNCVTGGNVWTSCLEAVAAAGAAIITPDPIGMAGQAAAGSGCLQAVWCQETPVTSSCDPNEIIGPAGFGDNRFVAADQEMGYTIFYENDSALATTAAQRVEVRQKIHPNMNPLSLQLKEFGFANLSFQIPGNVPNYTTTVDLTDSLGVDLQFTAGVDIINNEFFWIMQSIDKNTGAAPYDPLAGFLAINDSIGSGEGYVKYSVFPANGVQTGDSITAEAEILFDVNSTISTNKEFNIIDAVAPTSTLDPLLVSQDSLSFEVTWTAVDDSSASGVGTVVLYVSENNKPYTAAAVTNGDSSIIYTGSNLSSYRFFTVAIDNVGNAEVIKPYEVNTFINASDLKVLSPDKANFCVGDSMSISWRPGGIDQVNLSLMSLSDSTEYMIAALLDSLQTPYQWLIPDSLGNDYYLVRVSDTSDLYFNVSDSVGIGADPSVNLSQNGGICIGDSIVLSVSGGSDYRWWMDLSLSDTLGTTVTAKPVATTTYFVEVFNEFGCSSFDSVEVVVNLPDTTYLANNTCDSNMAGVFTQTFANQYGCDSLVINTVTYRPDYLTIENAAEVCQGDSILIYGEYRMSSSTYYDTLQSQYGCDSVLAMELFVNPTYFLDQGSQQICSGDSIMVFGEYQQSAGIYYDSLATPSGCDSIRYVNLSLKPVYLITQTLSICQGDSMLLENSYRSVAGIYTDVLGAQNSCDSTVLTSLVILPQSASSEVNSICQGDSIILGGSWQSAAGNYVDVYSAANGCDSTVTTALSVLPEAVGFETARICLGDSVQLGGLWQSISGNYLDVYQAANGCDSVVTTALTVDPSYDLNNNVSICIGDSMLLGGQYRKTTGTYTDTYQTLLSCDSVIHTALNVIPDAVSNESVSICQGDSLLVGLVYRNTSGSYPVTLMANTGCDSIHTLNLTVLPNTVGSQSLSICQGDSTLLGGMWQASAGSFVDVYQAVNGCDSTLTSTLSILPNTLGTQSLSICQGDSILLGGSYQTTAGNYLDVLSAANGCDSNLTSTLTIKPLAFRSTTANICQGDSLFIGGAWQIAAGNYDDVYPAANGCDSTVTTALTIIPNVTNSASASICQGDSVLIGGAWQTSAGNYMDVFLAANGCDSILTTSVAVLTVPSSSIINSICPDDSVFFAGSWRQQIGTFTDTLTAANGCDSLYSLNLSHYPEFTQSANTNICRGDSVFLAGAWRNSSGSYVDNLSTINGCDSIVTTILSITVVDTAVSLANAVLTANASGAQYRWIDCATGQYIPTANSKVFAPTSNGVYACEVTENGCTDTSGCRLVNNVGLPIRNLDQMKFHPNPTEDMVYFELGSIYGNVEVSIISAAGKQLRVQRFNGVDEFSLDLGEFPVASYFIQIKTDDGNRIVKIVKE